MRIDFEHYESAILKFKGLDLLSLVVPYGFNDRDQSPTNIWVHSFKKKFEEKWENDITGRGKPQVHVIEP